MAALPYMPFYPADYLADTRHLSTTEHGAYLLLILSYWNSGKPLPDNDDRLARLAGLSADEWAAMRDVMAEFFDIAGGEWRHKRIDRDLEAISAKVDKAKAAANKRWQSPGDANANAPANANGHANANADADATAMPYQNQNQNQNKEEPKGSCASDDALTPDEIVEEWNELADQLGLAKVRKLTDTRKRNLMARLRQYPDLDDWKLAFDHIRKTPFLTGDNRNGWRADFDFLVQQKSFTKLVEGAYGQAD